MTSDDHCPACYLHPRRGAPAAGKPRMRCASDQERRAGSQSLDLDGWFLNHVPNTTLTLPYYGNLPTCHASDQERRAGSQFLDPDGWFPNHVPNPEDAGAMAAGARAVIRSKVRGFAQSQGEAKRKDMCWLSGRLSRQQRARAQPPVAVPGLEQTTEWATGPCAWLPRLCFVRSFVVVGARQPVRLLSERQRCTRSACGACPAP
jgi:hypothetical protein